MANTAGQKEAHPNHGSETAKDLPLAVVRIARGGCGVGHSSQLERATLACGVGHTSPLGRVTGLRCWAIPVN